MDAVQGRQKPRGWSAFQTESGREDLLDPVRSPRSGRSTGSTEASSMVCFPDRVGARGSDVRSSQLAASCDSACFLRVRESGGGRRVTGRDGDHVACGNGMVTGSGSFLGPSESLRTGRAVPLRRPVKGVVLPRGCESAVHVLCVTNRRASSSSSHGRTRASWPSAAVYHLGPLPRHQRVAPPLRRKCDQVRF